MTKDTLILEIDSDAKIGILEGLYLRGKLTDDPTPASATQAISAYLVPPVEAHIKSTPASMRRFEKRFPDGGKVRFAYPRIGRIPHESQLAYVDRVCQRIEDMYKAVVQILSKDARPAYAERVESLLKAVRAEGDTLP